MFRDSPISGDEEGLSFLEESMLDNFMEASTGEFRDDYISNNIIETLQTMQISPGFVLPSRKYTPV